MAKCASASTFHRPDRLAQISDAVRYFHDFAQSGRRTPSYDDRVQCLKSARLFVLGIAMASGCRFTLRGEVAPDAAVDVDGGANDLATSDQTMPVRDMTSIDPNKSDLSAPDLSTTNLVTPDMTVVATPLLSGVKSSGSASINLSTEGTTDWIHLGLTAPSDVNREATGGSKIVESANSGLTQYTTYSTSFSWSDGAPTAAASNTTNGVYVLGTNRGFTITAPADTTTHTLRLCLNVGGTASLTAHLSDGSAGDYTDTQSNSNNGAIWLYTLRYAAASNAQSLSITWLLTSGTGVSLVAATLQ